MVCKNIFWRRRAIFETNFAASSSQLDEQWDRSYLSIRDEAPTRREHVAVVPATFHCGKQVMEHDELSMKFIVQQKTRRKLEDAFIDLWF